MTTTQPADPLREALDAHEWRPTSRVGDTKCTCGWPSGMFASYEAWADHREAAVRAALGDHATLGLAWASVEAALEDDKWCGWHGPTIDRGWHDWEAAAIPPVEPDYGEQDPIEGRGPTPEAALLALHAALTEKKP